MQQEPKPAAEQQKTKANPGTYFPIILLAAALLLILSVPISAFITYYSGHPIVDDKTGASNNINVMLTRPDNWHKIQTGQISLSEREIALIDGSTATIPITAELIRQFLDKSDENVAAMVDHNTTDCAYQYLIGKSKDIIFVTEPSEDELAAANAHHVTLDVTPIALAGFVFITHRDNPVSSLTVQQIRDIYSGKITNWKDVGGNDEEIIPYQRERNSGSQTAMEQLVMQDAHLMIPKEGYTVEGMGSLIEHVAEYENAQNSLGYTYYYYLSNLYKSDEIKVLAIDGVLPDNAHLISHAYPFTTAYYAVIREGDTGMPQRLRDYLLTDEGQEIIRLAGYCPVRE